MGLDNAITIGKAARLAKITVRTLHHFDKIGLLCPELRGSGEYRLYTPSDLRRLQQILLYRDAGLPLESIRRILDDPVFDERGALREHRERLALRLRETRDLIDVVDRMLEKGDAMNHDEMFEGFQPEEYEEEARERWGDTESYKVSKQRLEGYSRSDMQAIKSEHAEILSEFAATKTAGVAPTDLAAMNVAERARLFIDRWFYPLSRERHVQLGQMYAADPRFKATYETVCVGLADYVHSAIESNERR